MQVDSSRFSKLRLIGALFVAAFASPFSIWGWRNIWGSFAVWIGFMRQPYLASDKLVEARLAVCRACPIFYSPLRSCGSPLRKDLRGLGCYCNMEAKARLFYADCWYRIHSGDADIGWPDSLRRKDGTWETDTDFQRSDAGDGRFD
jgi:hypothetical protein